MDTASSMKTIITYQKDSIIILGKNHREYLSKYFTKVTNEKDREQTYMEKIIFQIISILRDENLKHSFQTNNYQIHQVEHPIELKFIWLHLIPYKITPISTILKVQNIKSKKQVYVLDSQEYNKYYYQFEKAIDNQNKGYKSYIILYDEKKPIQVKIPSCYPQISSSYQQLPSDNLKMNQETFYIQKFQKSTFKSFNFKSKNSINTQLENMTSQIQKRKFGKQRDTQLKFFFLTNRVMPQKLRRYIRSMTVVINDMLKFVGFDEQIRFEANYQTNQVQLIIRNSKKATFYDLKTGKNQLSGIHQAQRYMYTTPLQQKNMLAFIDYCELQRVEIVPNCDLYQKEINEVARIDLLTQIKIQTQRQFEESRKNLQKMQLTGFQDCIFYYYPKYGANNKYQFSVATMKIKDFIKKYQQGKDNEIKMMKHCRDYVFNQPSTQTRQIKIQQKQWCVKEKTSFTNLRQLLVIDALIQRNKKQKQSSIQRVRVASHNTTPQKFFPQQ